MAQLERVTGGWWVQVPFFRVVYLHQDSWFRQMLIYGAPFLFVGALAIFVGAVFIRWHATGLYVGMSLLILAGGLVAALITVRRDWPAVGHWFATSSPLALFAGRSSLAAVPLAGAAYLMLRRATPA